MPAAVRRRRFAICHEAGSRALSRSSRHAQDISASLTPAARPGVGSEIDDIGHINIIPDNCERLHSVRKALRHFDDHGVDRRSKIERRNAFRIEAATCNCSTLPRRREEGPSRIMATIESGLQPHAKLPSATPSR